MSRRIKLDQRQWLNIIIIVISVMFLLLLLLGKLMNENSQPAFEPIKVAAVAKLKRIDFGSFSLWKKNGQWQSIDIELSLKEIIDIVDSWQNLLQSTGRPLTGEVPSGQNILLYLEQIEQPIICKLSRQGDTIQFTFIGTAQQFDLESVALERFLPRSK